MRLFKHPPEHMVVHHSATKPSMDWQLEDLWHYHVNERGYQDIAYHYVLTRDGKIEHGRDKKYQGAHCKANNMNAKSYGVCLIGGIDENGKPENNYTFRQLNSLFVLHGILNLIPSGHHEWDSYNKPFCPMFNVKEFLGYHESN